MVRKDLNHPSVILYSIGNEIPETTGRSGATRARDLAEKVRSLDDTRFTTNGVNGIDGRWARSCSPTCRRTFADAGGVDESTGVNTAATTVTPTSCSAMMKDRSSR